MQDNNRKGFTLIELLIVVVIIGILAAIAIPKFSSTREKAFVSAMKSDLKNGMSLQEMYYSDPANGYTYGATVGEIGLTPSEGVLITVAVVNDGYELDASHSGTDITCSVSTDTGSATPGAITCTDAVVAP